MKELLLVGIGMVLMHILHLGKQYLKTKNTVTTGQMALNMDQLKELTELLEKFKEENSTKKN